ncbi:MAG: hypothetical protein V1827_02275 [Candidatus Micrarchaeota archaeon]
MEAPNKSPEMTTAVKKLLGKHVSEIYLFTLLVYAIGFIFGGQLDPGIEVILWRVYSFLLLITGYLTFDAKKRSEEKTKPNSPNIRASIENKKKRNSCSSEGIAFGRT